MEYKFGDKVLCKKDQKIYRFLRKMRTRIRPYVVERRLPSFRVVKRFNEDEIEKASSVKEYEFGDKVRDKKEKKEYWYVKKLLKQPDHPHLVEDKYKNKKRFNDDEIEKAE